MVPTCAAIHILLGMLIILGGWEMGRLVIDGNSVYEIDEECIRKREQQERKKEGKPTEDKNWDNNKRKNR